MKNKASRLIEGLIKAQMAELQAIKDAKTKRKSQTKKQKPTKTLVVTISRDFGSLGDEIARLLANSLELRCCDCFILQEVARRADVDESLVKALDEHVHVIDSLLSEYDERWWKRLINRYSFTHDEYQEHLAKTILSISLHGGVILGRGANFILGPERAFRVRITGSPERCARRIAKAEGISIEKAFDKVHEVNDERRQYIRKLYDADVNDPLFYDLVINTDRFKHKKATDLILVAMQHAGYKLPSGALEATGAHT